MELILSDLYYLYKEKYRFSLLAGEEGLGGILTWVYVSEDILTTDFLRGGELVITTGLSAHQDKEWLYKFIREIINRQSCGLIINTGNYISQRDISDEVIEYCNQYKFPLITMPWHIHISDVMNDYYNEIFVRNYQENIISNLFQNIIMHPETALPQTPVLNSYGFDLEASYRIAVMCDMHSPLLLQNILNNLTIRHHVFAYENQHILIFQNCTGDSIGDTFLKFFDSINRNSSNSQNLHPYIGMGNNVDSLTRLSFSYKEAALALEVAKEQNANFLFFNDLGIYRILLSVPNKELLRNIFTESLKVLVEYDQQNHTDLVDTLMHYLDSDGSVQKTAQTLFTHRNTINYRMQKINALLKKDLTSAQDKFDLKMAFYIKKMLQI